MNTEEVETNVILKQISPIFDDYKQTVVKDVNKHIDAEISRTNYFSPWSFMYRDSKVFGYPVLSKLKSYKDKSKIDIDNSLSAEHVCDLFTSVSKVADDVSTKISENKHIKGYFERNSYSHSDLVKNVESLVKADLISVIKTSLSDSDFSKVFDLYIENFKPDGSFLVNYIFEHGIISDVSVMSKILLTFKDEKVIEDNKVFYLLSNVSVKTLLHFKNHKDKKVRRLVYERLGVEDYLDDMLKDRDKDIRVQALRFCPKDYPYLEKMVNDRSQYVLRYVIEKLSKEKCIFLLGNSKIQKNSWLMQKLNEKINS